MENTISLCMIVKNEENTLPRCLSSVKDLVDEIIIVDTGSSDRTMEIARQFTDRVYTFEWIDDFAAARNYSFRFATKTFIMWLDADDVVQEKDQRLLRKLKAKLHRKPLVNSIAMPYHTVVDESGHVQMSIRRDRIVRRSCNFQWVSALHEQLVVQGNVMKFEAAIVHCQVDKKSHAQRNLKILSKMKEAGNFSTRDWGDYADALYGCGMINEAIEAYETFLTDLKCEWKEEQIFACHGLAKCYGEIGNTELQVRALLRTLAIDEPRAACYIEIGDCYVQKEDWHQAISWYKKASELPKRKSQLTSLIIYPDWIPNFRLCYCYLKLGDPNKAFEYHLVSLKQAPNNPANIQIKEAFKRQFGLPS